MSKGPGPWRVLRKSHVRSGWGLLVCSAWRRQRGDLIAVTTPCEGKEEGQALSSALVTVTGLKLCQGQFRLGIRERFFTQRVAGHWSRLPREGSQHQPDRIQEVFGLSGTGCDSWGVLCRARSWMWWPWWVPSNSAYPMFYETAQLSIYVKLLFVNKVVRKS